MKVNVRLSWDQVGLVVESLRESATHREREAFYRVGPDAEPLRDDAAACRELADDLTLALREMEEGRRIRHRGPDCAADPDLCVLCVDCGRCQYHGEACK